MVWVRNLSLKFKLIILLVVLTGTMLVTFGALTLLDFEKDKIAYVLDSSLEHSRSTAMQIRSEVGFVTEKIKFLMRGYDSSTYAFHPYSISIFSQENNFDAVVSFYRDKEAGIYKKSSTLKKEYISDTDISSFSQLITKDISSVLDNEITIGRLADKSKWFIALRFDRNNDSPLIIASILNSSQFLNIFSTSLIEDTYVFDAKKNIVISPTTKAYKILDADTTLAFTEGLNNIKTSEGIYQYKHKNSETWLISIANIGFGELKVTSVIPKKAALSAIRIMIFKSTIFLIFLFFVTVFLSILSSSTLTASLKKLLAATREIAKGNFSITLDVKGEDEVGSLSAGFNIMTKEISRLMQETIEKTRMEGELKTAKLVQSTLFPKEPMCEGGLEIRGYYEPASECSGDWWHYKKINNHTIFCIGDATGHGVPAALITAAASSAAIAIETFPDMPLSEMMGVFNRIIYGTGNGQLMMTFFLGIYDHQTNIVTYCNASHEAPYLLSGNNNLKIEDIQFLKDVRGPRLGDKPNSVYKVAQAKLAKGDKIVLYTDGITELEDASGRMWGERSFIKCLISCHNNNQNINETVTQIATEMSNYRKTHPLTDDITYFMVQRSQSA
ncbi:MAG: hypothetical protein A2Z20_08945 [Bdellovibrionales bacterium RBG_16_40_8]|nr:MAG: hypothetical protein A2Z20_08945 [Bdellovibrionales bacterium RBG_16_40_8]